MSGTRQGGTRRQSPLPKDEALILLRSAVGYVLESGLAVGARNSDDGLVMTIAGAMVVYNDHGDADFTLMPDEEEEEQGG